MDRLLLKESIRSIRKLVAENKELKKQLATLIRYAQHADPNMVNEIMLGIEIHTAKKMLGRKTNVK